MKSTHSSLSTQLHKHKSMLDLMLEIVDKVEESRGPN